MASTNSTIDGMGFEEMNQEQIQPSNIMIAGSLVAGELGSFAGDLYGDNIYGAAVEDGEGTLYSNLLGSATTNVFDGFIQSGSFSTGAGSTGFIKFGIPYTSANSYYVVATPTGSSPGYEESYISGARHISGVNFVGAASLRYDWIAIGLR